eukprot:2120579-Rhodomonas_salina.1
MVRGVFQVRRGANSSSAQRRSGGVKLEEEVAGEEECRSRGGGDGGGWWSGRSEQRSDLGHGIARQGSGSQDAFGCARGLGCGRVGVEWRVIGAVWGGVLGPQVSGSVQCPVPTTCSEFFDDLRRTMKVSLPLPHVETRGNPVKILWVLLGEGSI